MLLNHIREFVTLAKTGNIADAAEILYISQATLSRHIKSFEAEIGVSLFDRTANRIEINERGKLLLPYAEKIQEMINDCFLNFQNDLRKLNGFLKIGTFSLYTQYAFAKHLLQFFYEHPENEVSFVENSSYHTLQTYLLNDFCDFVILIETQNSPNNELVSFTLEHDYVVAALPCNHPLAARESIHFDELKEEIFLMRDSKCLEAHMYKKCVEDTGIEPHVRYQEISSAELLHMVERGLGITLRPWKLSSKRNIPLVRFVKIEPEVKLYVNLQYKGNKQLSSFEKCFVDYMYIRKPETSNPFMR